MPISVGLMQIANEMTGSTGSIGLKGNIFNKCTATIAINAYKLVEASSSNSVQFAPAGYGSLDYIKIMSGSGGFAEFDIGEEILIMGTTSNNGTTIIIDKISNSLIRTTTTFTNETTTVGKIQGNYDFTSIEFQYGLVGNSEVINFLCIKGKLIPNPG